jgi:hypothetical protein
LIGTLMFSLGKMRVTAKRDFIETLASAKPVTALSELIWNSFDADADRVEPIIELNEMDRVRSVKARDDRLCRRRDAGRCNGKPHHRHHRPQQSPRHATAHAEKEGVITLDEYQTKVARGDG